MLVLGRQITERIVINHAGEQLIIEIVEARGGYARLGLDGPKSFVIKRDEITDPSAIGPRREAFVDKRAIAKQAEKHAEYVRNRFGMGDAS